MNEVQGSINIAAKGRLKAFHITLEIQSIFQVPKDLPNSKVFPNDQRTSLVPKDRTPLTLGDINNFQLLLSPFLLSL